jgi:hypothetical protein
MGSVQPLIELVKDNEASDLQIFEALLSLTNLAGCDSETQQRIISEKGLSVFSYAMFSDHPMVRKAATEAMSNLVPHPDLIDYLRDPEKLRLFVAFSSDFEENYECARAALGCIAMITNDADISHSFCSIDNTKKMVESILSSGKLELMHRVLVSMINLLTHDSDWIISSGTLAFCEAYIHTYNGNCDAMDLNFSTSEKHLFATTVEIAKEIVGNCPRSSKE